MIWIPAAQNTTTRAPREQIPPWLEDEVVESYVCWREAAAGAKDAYEHWTGSEGAGTVLAFAAYRAALDGEEAAAGAYRDCTERIAGRAA